LGSWSTDAIAQIKAGYETLAEAGGDLHEEYERKRAELSRRKANLSRQHELGLLDDTQLMARLAEIRHEEGQLNAPATTSIRPRWEDALRTMRALESLGAQWQEASEAGEHVLCHRMAFALLQGIYIDLLQGRMVGLRPKPDVYVPMKHRLAEHGWRERELGLLWNDTPDEFATRLARTHYEDVVEALQGGLTTTREIAAHLGIHYNNVHRVLRRLVHEGVVRAEQLPNAGRKHLRFEYLGPVRPQLAEPKLRPGVPSSLDP
jgi:predicted transcriptional regulator